MHKISLAEQKKLAKRMIPTLNNELINNKKLTDEEYQEGCALLAILYGVAND